MKNKLLSQNIVTQLFYSLCLILICTNLSWGQAQTIGSFPYMDGGFEGQTAGIVPKITFDATGVAGVTSSSVWNAQTGSGDSTINSDPAVARTGSKYATGVDTGTTFVRVLQSPTAASGYPADLTVGAYVVQYWIKNSTLAEIPAGVGPTGKNYVDTRLAIGTNVTSWTKYTQIATSSATSEITSFVGIGRVKVVGSFLVDDVVVYAGTAADVTAPLAASGGAASGLDVSWTASSDIDGGGYMVVRYASNPNPDNDPNANGIYAVGNTITNGTGSLIGTVVYTGTGTSFTDNFAGSVSGSDYYKIYTVDKAFNYATEIKATAVVSNDPTITSSIETLTGFNYAGVGPSASQSFLVSGSKLTNNLVVSTASTDFELSQDNFATAGVSSITLTAPTVAATTLYVRLKANLLGGSKSATVTIASPGANTLPNISLSGSSTKLFYYNGIGALSAASSWGANANGTGANPSAVTATYTHFVIANGNATTDAAWTLGSNSKVIVGTGSAVTLIVADTFPITGTIDAAANGSVLWQVATPAIVGPPAVYYSPTFGTLDSASEVHFQPATNASYGLGNGTAYGKLFIDGAGKVSVLAGATISTATVKTALTVISGSTLDFPVTNTHSITINAGASATIDGTIRAGKQGGLLGTVAGGATTTTVSILFVDATPNFTLGASSLVDYYRPNAAQTVSALPSGLNYANLTLSETGCTAVTSKVIPTTGITVSGILTVNLPGVLFSSTTVGADKITLLNGATINPIAGTLDAQPQTLDTNDVFYYNGSGLLSSNTSWGANANGSGANPSAVTATYTNFVIANGNATTDATWTLGTGSKVIVGNGSAVTLTIADTFPITGTIDATATGVVVWKHILSSPTFGTLDNASEVHLQPAANASYGLGNGTAYGKLFIDGAGKVSVLAGATFSTATVKTALTVVSGSTLDFPVTNTHSITINAGASATINGTVRAGKAGGLLGSTTDAAPATTTTVSILFVGTPNLTLGASSLVDYYRPNGTQTVSALPSGVNYANLTLSETGTTTFDCVKSIPSSITVSGVFLTLNLQTTTLPNPLPLTAVLPGFPSKTLNACNITLTNGATTTIIAGTFDCEPVLGITDVEFANNTISLYPNPAQEVLNVSSANSITKIEVYDLLGKKVASNNNAKNVNVSVLGKGVYVVKVAQENGSVVAKRFIKQ